MGFDCPQQVCTKDTRQTQCVAMLYHSVIVHFSISAHWNSTIERVVVCAFLVLSISGPCMFLVVPSMHNIAILEFQHSPIKLFNPDHLVCAWWWQVVLCCGRNIRCTSLNTPFPISAGLRSTCDWAHIGNETRLHWMAMGWSLHLLAHAFYALVWNSAYTFSTCSWRELAKQSGVLLLMYCRGLLCFIICCRRMYFQANGREPIPTESRTRFHHFTISFWGSVYRVNRL